MEKEEDYSHMIPLDLLSNKLEYGSIINVFDLVNLIHRYDGERFSDKIFECLDKAKRDGILYVEDEVNKFR